MVSLYGHSVEQGQVLCLILTNLVWPFTGHGVIVIAASFSIVWIFFLLNIVVHSFYFEFLLLFHHWYWLSMFSFFSRITASTSNCTGQVRLPGLNESVILITVSDVSFILIWIYTLIQVFLCCWTFSKFKSINLIHIVFAKYLLLIIISFDLVIWISVSCFWLVSSSIVCHLWHETMMTAKRNEWEKSQKHLCYTKIKQLLEGVMISQIFFFNFMPHLFRMYFIIALHRILFFIICESYT